MASKKVFDFAIIGAGALGCSCAYELAKCGHTVALFDKYHPPHAQGSSYGSTRLFRQAYFEDERYIPFLLESYDLWKEWESEFKVKLLYKKGYLTIFDSSSYLAQTMHSNAKKWNINGIELNAKQLKKKFPQFQNKQGYSAYLEKNAGILDTTKIFYKTLEHFVHLGGVAHFNHEVLKWKKCTNSYRIHTKGQNYHCSKIIVCSGAWLQEMKSLCSMPLEVKRGVQFWYQPPHSFDKSKDMPCFAFVIGKQYVFGFPPFAGQGIKIANYHPSHLIEDLDAKRNTYTKEELKSICGLTQQFFPWLPHTPIDFHVCMYTLTADEDFILDYASKDRNICILGGGSGHAFKFIPFLAKEVSKFFPNGKNIPKKLKFFAIR